MRNIYLDLHGRKHTIYNNLINYPPENYNVITNIKNIEKFAANFTKIDIPNLLMITINQILPFSLLKPYLEKNNKLPEDVRFIFAAGHIVFKDIPWVLDLEFVTQLCGYNLNIFKYYKGIIKKYLESDNCRKIIPWTDAGKETVLSSFDSDIIHDKTETVYLSVPVKKFVKQLNDDKIRILFAGSANLPKDFEIKGGKEVFKVFDILNKDYKNIELTVRSFVPKKLKEKYSDYENVKIIDKVVSWSLVEQEFKDADIFLFPSYQTPGLVLLDAMSYELPVITTDVWANEEMITNRINGFIIKKSANIDYYGDNFIPIWGSSIKKIKNNNDQVFIKEIAEKTRILIEDEKLRLKMGKKGRYEIENGKFSQKRRNEKLKRIFDKI